MKNKKLILLIVFTIMGMYTFSQNYAFKMNEKLGVGINLGNAYEATGLGEWGVNVDSSYFKDIKNKGFNSIRIPARWSAHALATSPYTISDYFMDTIVWAINQALDNQLVVVLDIHHYEEMFVNPAANKDRFISFWDQISQRFQGYSDSLFFEVFNEPHDSFTPTIWNEYLLAGLSKIRETNPTRMVIIGTAEYGGVGGLQKLQIPATDTCLIVTVHYYNPFPFTHQGADFAGNYPIGATWDSTATQINAVKYDMDIIQTYSQSHNVPIYIGEFGAIQNADDASRAKWAGHLRKTFKQYGFSSAYWEYCSGFGIYDAALNCYYNSLVKALTDSVGACDCAMYDTIIVKNSTFERGLNPWVQYENASSNAQGNLTLINEEAQIEIVQQGTADWHIQLVYGSFPLVCGSTYKFTFDAYASSPTSIVAQTSRDGGDYSVIRGNPIDLTTQKQTFSYTFTIDESTISKARIVFECGLAQAQYLYFDNVHLYEVEKGIPVSSIQITNNLLETNLSISENQGTEQLVAQVLPIDASNSNVIWSIISGSSLATISVEGLLTANGSGNGTVTVKALAFDGSAKYAQKSIVITNQESKISSVSSKCYLIIDNNSFEVEAKSIKSYEIYDVLGKIYYSNTCNNEKSVFINSSYLLKNMNFIKVYTDESPTVIKYFKK